MLRALSGLVAGGWGPMNTAWYAVQAKRHKEGRVMHHLTKREIPTFLQPGAADAVVSWISVRAVGCDGPAPSVLGCRPLEPRGASNPRDGGGPRAGT